MKTKNEVNESFYTLAQAHKNATAYKEYFIGTYGLLDTGDYVTVLFDTNMIVLNKVTRFSVKEMKNYIDTRLEKE